MRTVERFLHISLDTMQSVLTFYTLKLSGMTECDVHIWREIEYAELSVYSVHLGEL